MTTWKYKSGRRERALDTLEEVMQVKMSGFLGSLVLMSMEDPDSQVILTLWEDEAALRSSEASIFRKEGGFVGDFRRMEEFLDVPPRVENYRVRSANALKIPPDTRAAARLSLWKYTSSQREKALDTLEKYYGVAGRIPGFQGGFTLLSLDDPDSEVLITIWEDEEAMRASAQGLFRDTSRDLERYLAGPPEVKSYRVRSAEVREIQLELARPM